MIIMFAYKTIFRVNCGRNNSICVYIYFIRRNAATKIQDSGGMRKKDMALKGGQDQTITFCEQQGKAH